MTRSKEAAADEEATQAAPAATKRKAPASWLEEPTVRPSSRGPAPSAGAQHARRGRPTTRIPPRQARDPVAAAVDRWTRTAWKPLTDTEARISALAWWQRHETVHPLVADVARRVLCMQASSAASERSFSKGGLIVSKKRQCLKGAKVDGLSLVGWYYDEEHQGSGTTRLAKRKKKRTH